MAQIKSIGDQLTDEEHKSYTRSVSEQEFDEFYALHDTKHIISITKSEYGNYASVRLLAYPGDQNFSTKITRVMSKEISYDLHDQNDVFELQQFIKKVYNIND